jgi:ferritin-like metal-binding protein YciE
MKLFSANIEDLRTLYVSSLKKAFDMEQRITEALPKMIEKSTDPDLTNAFETHLQETRGHVVKIESLLRKATGEATSETCKVINGLTTEASDTIKDVTDPTVLNVALIGAAQQVEHHEIALYGTLRTWANILGETQDAAVLESILEQEENADEILTGISDRVNVQAAA